ncbi:MAG: hypothetical protein GX764_01405 [Firmicutes bacterium]|jgi:hypothetical protein|nr:hypothetical protein [Bacillota bacterium]
MNWIDIAAAVFVIWGGVCGYLKGSKKMLYKAVILLIALPPAFFLQNHLVFFAEERYLIRRTLARAFLNQLVIPVDLNLQSFSGSRSTELFWALVQRLGAPENLGRGLLLLREKIAKIPSVPNVSLEGELLSSILAQLILNCISFMVSVALIWGIFYLFEQLLVQGHKTGVCALLGHCAATFLGSAINLGLLVLFSGLLYPLGIIFKDNFFIREFNQSVIFGNLFTIFIDFYKGWL